MSVLHIKFSFQQVITIKITEWSEILTPAKSKQEFNFIIFIIDGTWQVSHFLS